MGHCRDKKKIFLNGLWFILEAEANIQFLKDADQGPRDQDLHGWPLHKLLLAAVILLLIHTT